MMKLKKGERKEIGLAIVGAGTIGKIRAALARDYPGVGWLGVCDEKYSIRQPRITSRRTDSAMSISAEPMP
jgi:hypothetical protein